MVHLITVAMNMVFYSPPDLNGESHGILIKVVHLITVAMNMVHLITVSSDLHKALLSHQLPFSILM